MTATAAEHGRSERYGDAVEQLATAEGWRTAYPRLDRAGAQVLGALVAGLAHPHPKVRQWCAALLDHHADERCVSGLLRLLDDPVAAVRRHALHAIGCQPCKPSPLAIDVVPVLLARATRDPSVRVRRAAAHLLGCQPPDARAAAGLRLVAERDPDSRVRRNAHWALGRHAGTHERARKCGLPEPEAVESDHLGPPDPVDPGPPPGLGAGPPERRLRSDHSATDTEGVP